jgi:hypothetical protein
MKGVPGRSNFMITRITSHGLMRAVSFQLSSLASGVISGHW